MASNKNLEDRGTDKAPSPSCTSRNSREEPVSARPLLGSAWKSTASFRRSCEGQSCRQSPTTRRGAGPAVTPSSAALLCDEGACGEGTETGAETNPLGLVLVCFLVFT